MMRSVKQQESNEFFMILTKTHISIQKYACNFYVLIFYCKTHSKCCKRVLHINIRTHTPHSTISFREWCCVSARKTCHHITSFHKKDGVTLQKKGWARPYLQSFFRLLNHREGEEEQELLVWCFKSPAEAIALVLW